jgi:hypothetical protein
MSQARRGSPTTMASTNLALCGALSPARAVRRPTATTPMPAVPRRRQRDSTALYRAYDPVARRWLSRDPLGEGGGRPTYHSVRSIRSPLQALVGTTCSPRAPMQRAVEVVRGIVNLIADLGQRAEQNVMQGLGRLRQAFRVPILWDKAVARASTRRFGEALQILERVDDVNPYASYRRVMIGHCHWQLGNHDLAGRAFEDATAQLARDDRISDRDKEYLLTFVAAHFEPQSEIRRDGVSDQLLRWFTLGGVTSNR